MAPTDREHTVEDNNAKGIMESVEKLDTRVRDLEESNRNHGESYDELTRNIFGLRGEFRSHDKKLDGLSLQISEAKGFMAALTWFKNLAAAAIGAAVATAIAYFTHKGDL